MANNPLPDFVYVFKNSVIDGEDLKYSLRSLQNVPHGKVFVIGDKPSWLSDRCVYVSIPQRDDRPKFENSEENLRAACSDRRLSDNFVLMNDDFFIMKKIDFVPTLHRGLVTNVVAEYKSKHIDAPKYTNDMLLQKKQLEELNIKNILSYELHAPMPLNKNKYLEMIYKIKIIPSQRRTAYGNYYHLGGELIKDVKIYPDNSPRNPADFINNPDKYLRTHVFLSATNESFRSGLVGGYIKNQLDRKSAYEK